MIATLIVIAKRPVPTFVKTRLVPPLTYEQAAELAAAALADTLAAVDRTPSLRKILAFDGRVDGWLPRDWEHAAQPTGPLDQRLAAAFAAAGRSPALLVGMDTPQVQPQHMTRFDPSRFDACLGPASDGGYWAIGFRDPAVAAQAIIGVPMSSAFTAEAQLRRLSALGLCVQLLDELTDVDLIDDAYAVAEASPGSSFAAALRSMVAVPHRIAG